MISTAAMKCRKTKAKVTRHSERSLFALSDRRHDLAVTHEAAAEAAIRAAAAAATLTPAAPGAPAETPT